MKNCFITKLNSVVENTTIPQMGYMHFFRKKNNNVTGGIPVVIVNLKDDDTLKIVQGGYFTDKTSTQNLGKTLDIKASQRTQIYVSNEDTIISIPKYKLNLINNLVEESNYESFSKKFNINDLKYSFDLSSISFLKETIVGDISALKNLTSLTYLNISSSQTLTGDISALKNLTSLTEINLYYTKVTGDISVLQNHTNLKKINLEGLTEIAGDISTLKNLSLEDFNIKGVNNLFGNLGDVPDSILFLSNNNGNSKFTWSGTSRRYIMALEKIHCDAIDKMLNDMASLEANFKTSFIWHKSIILIGTRTSASDEAVATLQEKGYTVSITPNS